MGKCICNTGCVADLEYALEVRMESFPHFDLTILTRKQLDVLVMRYRGGLSWRKIAAFEGVSDYAVRCRHAGASKKLRQQGPKSP